MIGHGEAVKGEGMTPGSAYHGLQDFTNRLLVLVAAIFSGENDEKKPYTCSKGILLRMFSGDYALHAKYGRR